MKIIVWTACIFLIMNMGLGQFGPSFAPGCPSCTCVNDEGVNVSFVQGGGLPMYFCVFFANAVSGSSPTITRIVYPITIDEFTVVSLGGTANYFLNSGNPTNPWYIYLMGHDLKNISYPMPFFNPGSYYANTFNVVIRLTGGFVSDVIWDDISLTLSGCTDQCPSPETWTFAANNSVNGNGYDDSDVDQVDNVYGYCSSLVSGTNSALGSTCDVKIFVSFVGTDGNGNSLQSAGLRLSRFTEAGVTGYQNDAMFNLNPCVLNNDVFPQCNGNGDI